MPQKQTFTTTWNRNETHVQITRGFVTETTEWAQGLLHRTCKEEGHIQTYTREDCTVKGSCTNQDGQTHCGRSQKKDTRNGYKENMKKKVSVIYSSTNG